LLEYGGGNATVEPPLTHCVVDARVAAPEASARNSVSAERDGGGATRTLTALL
jgi:hypothetical protein